MRPVTELTTKQPPVKPEMHCSQFPHVHIAEAKRLCLEGRACIHCPCLDVDFPTNTEVSHAAEAHS